MARASGKLFLLQLEPTTPVTLALQTECTLSVESDAIDVTAKADAAGTFVKGDQYSWSVDFSGQYDDTQVTHDTLFTDVTTGNEQDLTIDLNGAAETYSGKGFLTSFSIEGGNGSPLSFSGTYQGSGALSKT